MKKKIKLITVLIIVNILLSIILSLFQYNIKAVYQTVSNDINSIDTNKYPGIKEKIQNLKSEHPNWNFKILYTGINWEEAIANEYTGHGSSPRNLIPDSSSYSGEWICSQCGDKTYDSGSWKCASSTAIKYMMDPRTHLNSSDVFQFLELSYDETNGYSKDIVKQMLSGSFLDQDSYINAIMNACKNYKVNPYYIVARILQEQGKSGSTLTKGQGYNGQYVGYYNVFNIGASGSSKEKVILNGLAKAKNYGWTNMELSLEGGIKIISSSYIAVGQNTLYLQKFDVDNSDGKLYWHQYMQNVLAAKNEGTTLKTTFNNMNAIDYPYTFMIPVYENMPTNVSSKPSTENPSNPNESDNKELVRVNVTSSIKIRNEPNGSTIKGYLYSGEIATRLEKATSKVNGTYWDKVLKNDGTVGYVARCTYDYETNYKEYLVPVEEKPNNSPNENNNPNPSGSSGDINGDNKIDSMDMYIMIQHILENETLTGEKLNKADMNSDGKIDAMDMYIMIQKIINN